MPTYTKPSDVIHKIKLTSNLIYAIWSYPRAHAGQMAPVEVRTSLVGDGAKIKITCYTENGKKLEKVEGVVLNNRYNGTVLIPDKVKPDDDMIWFEVELPKHNLMGESNLIPVRPPITVSRLEWDRQEVKREDVVTINCQFASGVEDGDEAVLAIYEYNPNSYDVKIVSMPTIIKKGMIEMAWKFNYEGDINQISTNEELQPYQKAYVNPKYYFIPAIDGVRIGENRESGLLTFVDELTLDCLNECEEITADLSYIVHMADGNELKGSFGQEKKITLTEVCPGPLNVVVEDSGDENSDDLIRSPLNDALDSSVCTDSLLEQYMTDNRERE